MSYPHPPNIYQQLGQVQPATAVHPQYSQNRPPPVARSAFQHQQHQQQASYTNGATNYHPSSRPRPVSLPAQARPLPTPSQAPGRRSPLDLYAPPPLHPSQHRPKYPNQAAPQLSMVNGSAALQPAHHQPSLRRSPAPSFGHDPRTMNNILPPNAANSQFHPRPHPRPGPSSQPAIGQPSPVRERSYTYDAATPHSQWNQSQSSHAPQWSTNNLQHRNDGQWHDQQSHYPSQPSYPQTAPPPQSSAQYFTNSHPHTVVHQPQHPPQPYYPNHVVHDHHSPAPLAESTSTSQDTFHSQPRAPDTSPTRSEYVINARVSSPNPSAELVRKYSKKGRTTGPVRFSASHDPESGVDSSQSNGVLTLPPAASPISMSDILPALPEVEDPKKFVPLYKRKSSPTKLAAFPSTPPREMQPREADETTPKAQGGSSARSRRPLPIAPSGSTPTSPVKPSFSLQKRTQPLPAQAPLHDVNPAREYQTLNRSDTVSTSSSTKSNGSMHRRERAILSESDDSEREPEPPSPGIGIRDLPLKFQHVAHEPPSPGMGIRDLPALGKRVAGSAREPAHGPIQRESRQSSLPAPPGQTSRRLPPSGTPKNSVGSEDVPGGPGISQTLRFAAMSLQQDSQPQHRQQPPPANRHSHSLSYSGNSGVGSPSRVPNASQWMNGSTPQSPQNTVTSTPSSPKTMKRAQFAARASSPRSPRFAVLDVDAELETPPPRREFPAGSPLDGSRSLPHPNAQLYSPPNQSNEIRPVHQPAPQNGIAIRKPPGSSQGRPHHAQSYASPVKIESPAPLGGREQQIQLADWDTSSPNPNDVPASYFPPTPARIKSRALPTPNQHYTSQGHAQSHSTPKSQPATPRVQIFEVPGIGVEPSSRSPVVPTISIDGGGGGNGGPSISVTSASDVPTISIGGESPQVPTISVGDEDFEHNKGPPADKANPHNRPPIKKYPGLRCGLCAGAIVGRMVDAMGVRWHPSCFRCTVCDELLEHVSSYEHEGRPYCHLDYHENFAPRCYHCHTAILEPRFISIDDDALGGKRTYHENHFFCAECGDPFLDPSRKGSGLLGSTEGELTLSEGSFEGFTVYKGHPYCEACHIRLRNPKCKKCKRAIRDGDEAVEALGAKWCRMCFCCAGCHIPFHTPSFYERDKDAWCADCFSIILRNDL